MLRNQSKLSSRQLREMYEMRCLKREESRYLWSFQGNPELSGRTTSRHFGVFEDFSFGKDGVLREAVKSEYLWKEKVPPVGESFQLRTKRKYKNQVQSQSQSQPQSQVAWEQVRPAELFDELDFCVCVVTRFGYNEWCSFSGQHGGTDFSTVVHYVKARPEYENLVECQKYDDEGNLVFTPGPFRSGLYDLSSVLYEKEFREMSCNYTPYYEFGVELVPMTTLKPGTKVLTEEEYCLLREKDFSEAQTLSDEERLNYNHLF
jgi:hypothetical protein